MLQVVPEIFAQCFSLIHYSRISVVCHCTYALFLSYLCPVPTRRARHCAEVDLRIALTRVPPGLWKRLADFLAAERSIIEVYFAQITCPWVEVEMELRGLTTPLSFSSLRRARGLQQSYYKPLIYLLLHTHSMTISWEFLHLSFVVGVLGCLSSAFVCYALYKHTSFDAGRKSNTDREPAKRPQWLPPEPPMAHSFISQSQLPRSSSKACPDENSLEDECVAPWTNESEDEEEMAHGPHPNQILSFAADYSTLSRPDWWKVTHTYFNLEVVFEDRLLRGYVDLEIDKQCAESENLVRQILAGWGDTAEMLWFWWREGPWNIEFLQWYIAEVFRIIVRWVIAKVLL